VSTVYDNLRRKRERALGGADREGYEGPGKRGELEPMLEPKVSVTEIAFSESVRENLRIDWRGGS